MVSSPDESGVHALPESSGSTVSYGVTGRVATIVLDRPDQGNAMTLELVTDLVDALDRADADDEVAAVVLTGRGRQFCLGADLGEGFHHGGREPHPRHVAFIERFGEINGVPRDAGGVVTLRIAAMLKPIIAAVNGAAVGGGASMLLPCDIRVVGQSSRVGFVFGRRGMLTESASSWFLPRIVGISQAAEWVLTGRLIGADELLRGGLAGHVVADDQILAKAYELASEIADNTSAIATGLSRQLLWSMLSASSPWDAHGVESVGVYDLPSRADVQEGVASFLEKRDAAFPLRVPRDYPDYGPRWPARPEGDVSTS
ncbi:enoyl-CoA hydratase-related protein [Aeromicrobium ginsengisoli]|uniref:Enoyl-CoA hydratase n=1 Tax=Aeromicrobium ginsengisoli TaxID=363867 RepID=A0A5M4F8V3_9ACTN|nr:enoyl-CoA hydratase-related protein [Aeromicrobium ginsengisoli]KAA1394222.1 enoyl-CoA hydratase [Aeromicrobium ginsengisoli]